MMFIPQNAVVVGFFFISVKKVRNWIAAETQCEGMSALMVITFSLLLYKCSCEGLPGPVALMQHLSVPQTLVHWLAALQPYEEKRKVCCSQRHKSQRGAGAFSLLQCPYPCSLGHSLAPDPALP